MEVHDFEGRAELDSIECLIRRLRSVRRGRYGATVLTHDSSNNDQPSLFIHVNGAIAYLHYFPDNEGLHAGFQATGMMPGDCENEVHFLMVTGTEADSFIMPREALVPAEIAYKAAEEFLEVPTLPRSISWFEL